MKGVSAGAGCGTCTCIIAGDPKHRCVHLQKELQPLLSACLSAVLVVRVATHSCLMDDAGFISSTVGFFEVAIVWPLTKLPVKDPWVCRNIDCIAHVRFCFECSRCQGTRLRTL